MSPIDADCTQGKHPACPGYTYIDRDDDVWEVPCDCSCHRPLAADRHE